MDWTDICFLYEAIRPLFLFCKNAPYSLLDVISLVLYGQGKKERNFDKKRPIT